MLPIIRAYINVATYQVRVDDHNVFWIPYGSQFSMGLHVR